MSVSTVIYRRDNGEKNTKLRHFGNKYVESFSILHFDMDWLGYLFLPYALPKSIEKKTGLNVVPVAPKANSTASVCHIHTAALPVFLS